MGWWRIGCGCLVLPFPPVSKVSCAKGTSRTASIVSRATPISHTALFMQQRAAQDILYPYHRRLTMTLKLKLLRIISFTMQEFDLDRTHLFVLIMEDIEMEALRHEQRLLTAVQSN